MLAFGIDITTDQIVDGAITAPKLADGAVTNGKLADMAQGLLKGRAAGAGTGDPTDLTGVQVKAILGAMQTADIGDDQITFAKLQNIATDRLLGRDTASSGDPEELTVGGGIEFTGSGGIQRGALTGDATAPAGSGAVTLVQASSVFAMTGAITPAQITATQNDYNPTGLSTASVLRVSSDSLHIITGLAGGSPGRLIYLHNVGSEALMLEDESSSSSAANRFALSGNVFFVGDEGLLLQYDGTSSRWREVSGRSMTITGDGTATGTSLMALTIANDVITNAKLANMAQNTIKGRQITAGTGDPEDLTAAQARAIIFDLLTAKGSIVAATAAGTAADLPVGSDGANLQAFAGATPGLRYAGAPAVMTFARAAIGSNVTLSMSMGVADSDFVVPTGWILKIVALVAHSPLTTANTLTVKLHVDDVDQSGSFTTLLLAASTTDAKDDAEPNSPPFTVDASAGAKRVGFTVTSSNNGGGNAVCSASIIGYFYKAT